MERINNLTDFLTDVANAIKNKKRGETLFLIYYSNIKLVDILHQPIYMQSENSLVN